MKARRLFQVASAMVAIVFGVALIVVATLTVLSFVTNLQLAGEGILKDFHDGATAVAASLTFLPTNGNLGEILYLLIAFLLPGVLLIVGALLLFGKKRSNAKYAFADVLIVFAALLFSVLFVMYAEKLFGNERAIAWIIGACSGAVMLMFLVIVSVTGKNSKAKTQKTAAKGAETSVEVALPIADTDKAQESSTERKDGQHDTQAERPQATAAVVNGRQQKQSNDVRSWTNMEKTSEEKDSKHKGKSAEQPAETQRQQPAAPKSRAEEEPATQYIPKATNSVSDVVAQTYGEQTKKPKDNWAKIEKLHILLDEKAITKDEYSALVSAYLKEENE